jgi:thiol-disulfide isomerase/thioredoxin
VNKVFAVLLILAMSPLAAYAAHTPAPAAQGALDRAAALDKEKKPEQALAAFVQAIEIDPDLLAAHDQLMEFRSEWGEAAYQHKDLKPQVDAMKKTIDAKYKEWERRFPDSAGIQYGIGAWLSREENPGAKPHLLKVLAHDPKNAKVYYMLAMDAERWGDKKASSDYMQQASLLEPQNADYAFYAATIGDIEPSKREAASLDVARRFPTSERGAQALYWLAARAPNDAKRIVFSEQLRTQFPPEKFHWSADGMIALFEAYLRVDPAKAVKLAQEMRGGKDLEASKEWNARVTLAQTYIEVNSKVANGKTDEAMAFLDKLTVDRFSSNTAMLLILKARVMAGAGQAQGAYDILLKQQAKAPDDEILTALYSTGKPLHKTAAQVDVDLKAALDAGAKEAAPFDLQQYGSNGTVSLAKLRGKVVFITFWFPGCGPCRAEMPHTETVLRVLHDKDIVYLGINGVSDQDAYVLPFMQKTQYSFTPLKGTDAVTGPKGYNVRGYPSNFLIDRAGRVVYHGFVIDDAHGEMLERRMLESLLARPARN